MQEVYKTILPDLPIGSGTSLGSALNYVMNDIDKNTIRATSQKKGDWKSLVFLFTDGGPTDDYVEAVKRWEYYQGKKASLIGVGIGDNADMNVLNSLSEQTVQLRPENETDFKKFFDWVSKSIQVQSAKPGSSDSIFEELIKSENGFPAKSIKEDDRYVILKGMCSTKKQCYLLKFTKNENIYDFEVGVPIDLEAYNELSAEDEHKKINTNNLSGFPSCPICSNPFSVVSCSRCARMFCGKGGSVTCPWCGNKGELVTTNGIIFDRSMG